MGDNMNIYMQEAIKEAKKSLESASGGPFGCVIVKDHKIIGRGHNKVVSLNDPTCHGEIVAIRDACQNLNTHDLSDADLYTTGQPCPMCLGAILWANIRTVYYGCNLEDAETIGFRDKLFYEMMQHQADQLLHELDRQSCYKLYQDYQTLENKAKY